MLWCWQGAASQEHEAAWEAWVSWKHVSHSAEFSPGLSGFSEALLGTVMESDFWSAWRNLAVIQHIL